MGAGSGRIRLSEVIGGLSYALDLTEGEPPGHAMRTCMIGMRSPTSSGSTPTRARPLLRAAAQGRRLLRELGADGGAVRRRRPRGQADLQADRLGARWPAFVWSLRTVAPGGSLRARVGRLRAIQREGEVTRALMQARCDRGADIALRSAFAGKAAEAIRTLDEHWDGRGQPRGLKGGEIPLLGADPLPRPDGRDFHAAGGADAAMAVARQAERRLVRPRARGGARAPCRDDELFWAILPTPTARRGSPWTRCSTPARTGSTGSPPPSPGSSTRSRRGPTGTRTARMIADGRRPELGADAAAVRASAAPRCCTTSASSRSPTGSSTSPAGSPPRSSRGSASIRSSRARICSRVPGFARLAGLAGAHHERLDGGGYPHGLGGRQLTMPMRVLAVTDVYEALTSRAPRTGAALSSSEGAGDHPRRRARRLDANAFAALVDLVGTETSRAAPRLATSPPGSHGRAWRLTP